MPQYFSEQLQSRHRRPAYPNENTAPECWYGISRKRSVSTIARLNITSVCHQTAAFLWSKKYLLYSSGGSIQRFGDLLNLPRIKRLCAGHAGSHGAGCHTGSAGDFVLRHLALCKTHTQIIERFIHGQYSFPVCFIYARGRVNCVTCKSQLFRCKDSAYPRAHTTRARNTLNYWRSSAPPGR